MGSESARLFLGLELGDKARKELGAFALELARAVDGRLYDPSLYHLTLCFLGQTPRMRIPELCRLIDGIAMPPLTLMLGELGVFKGGSVLWIGIGRPSDGLFAMQKALSAALLGTGYPVEVGAYVPHITLGRKVRRLQDMPQPPRAAFTARQITLFESTRVDGKLAYVPLHRGGAVD